MLPTRLPSDLKRIEMKTRNFAIGYDSFQIAILLKGARNLNRVAYKGLTGEITFKGQSIVRKSTIFRIENRVYKYLY